RNNPLARSASSSPRAISSATFTRANYQLLCEIDAPSFRGDRMNRRYCFVLLAAACATSPSPTKKEPEVAGKSIETADLDRSAAPCADFFQLPKGAWRAANPIPPSMQRWSRRWQSGEINKERLSGILEELSKGHWPAGSIEQQVGDHYASCMDQPAIDAAGI